MSHEEYIESLHKIKDIQTSNKYDSLNSEWELSNLLSLCEIYEEDLIREAVKQLNS